MKVNDDNFKCLLRSHVWSEDAFIEKAAFDFSETEAMLKTAEVIF